jgi:tRNA A-37 threonylcarbamoyl transferase component Bud32
MAAQPLGPNKNYQSNILKAELVNLRIMLETKLLQKYYQNG